MTTWDTVYNGFDPQADALAQHPDMYSSIASNGSEYMMIHDGVIALSTDVN